MSNILVTGSNGQLGSELKDLSSLYLNDTFIFTDVAELDICNHFDVKEYIVKNEINIIINCAAYTAVDKAEEQFKLSNKINNLAVKNFASIAKEYNIKLIHVSTDYVFDGTNHVPYQETDKPNPQSVYGQTKLDGELAIQKINPANTIIIRTSWVYSNYGNNFVKTMLRLGKEREELDVIFDQIGTPTNASDLGKAILTILPLIKNKNVEVFHYSSEGVCSWYDFAKSIFEIGGINVKVNAIETFQYRTAAKRPFYSVLNKSKIKNKFQIEIPNWKDSLIVCLQRLNVHKRSNA
jgi:dTDP-4-dehydrorhamnose reductase